MGACERIGAAPFSHPCNASFRDELIEEPRCFGPIESSPFSDTDIREWRTPVGG